LNEKKPEPYFTGVWGTILLMKNEETRGKFSNKAGDYDRIPLILLIRIAV
jgi:hypothetical protein